MFKKSVSDIERKLYEKRIKELENERDDLTKKYELAMKYKDDYEQLRNEYEEHRKEQDRLIKQTKTLIKEIEELKNNL